MDPIVNEPNPVRRPAGMTFLLILSLINAIYQIMGAIMMYFFAPAMRTMMDSGELEESVKMLVPSMDNTMFDAMMDNMAAQLSVSPTYYLILALLFIGSLTGVIKMFKLQRIGFHIYSISQLLMLIAAVVYVYPHQVQHSFFSEFLTTILFILMYHLYFKRIEFQQSHGT